MINDKVLLKTIYERKKKWPVNHSTNNMSELRS